MTTLPDRALTFTFPESAYTTGTLHWGDSNYVPVLWNCPELSLSDRLQNGTRPLEFRSSLLPTWRDSFGNAAVASGSAWRSPGQAPVAGGNRSDTRPSQSERDLCW